MGSAPLTENSKSEKGAPRSPNTIAPNGTKWRLRPRSERSSNGFKKK